MGRHLGSIFEYMAMLMTIEAISATIVIQYLKVVNHERNGSHAPLSSLEKGVGELSLGTGLESEGDGAPSSCSTPPCS